MTQSELASIIRRLDEMKKGDADRAAEQEILWKRVYELADDLAGEGEAYTYLDPELKMSIGRSVAQSKPQLDVAALRLALTDEEWKLVTRQERVFDADKLELAVAQDKIAAAVVQEATTTPPPTMRKSGPKAATKAQLVELAGGMTADGD